MDDRQKRSREGRRQGEVQANTALAKRGAVGNDRRGLYRGVAQAVLPDAAAPAANVVLGGPGPAPAALVPIVTGQLKVKRLEALAKFLGLIWRVIALVDSRHDFGSMSQDTYIKIEGAVFDFLRNFANNIQRIVLFGDDAPARELSHHLTSICKGRIVMGSGPEDPFIEYTEIQVGLPNTPEAKDALTWNRIRNAPELREGEG